jgi:membrane dipeptidase
VSASATGIAPRRLIVDAAAPLFRIRWEEWCAIGTAAVLATVLVDADTLGALTQLGGWFRFLREHDDRLHLAETAGDVRRAVQEGKTAVVLHFQSSRPIGYDVGLVEVFKRLRVGVIALAYNVRGPLGDGSLEPTDGGLSRLGREAIKEMNRCGIIIDCSHAGIRTSLDAIAASGQPVIFSHSNARSVCDHPRNLTDEQIRACAAADGVIGVNAYPAFVKRSRHLTADDLIDHIAHISELVGVEHVGLGLDFFEATRDEYRRLVEAGLWDVHSYPPPPYLFPAGIDGPSAIPSFADRLSHRGFDQEAIDGVLGGNFLRVLETVWPTSREASH